MIISQKKDSKVKKRLPNIIIILADDLGYGDLSCYGSELHRTPNLDRLGKEGVQLLDFSMASSLCSPSRSALMTGCYPRRIGLGYGSEYGVLFPGDPIGLNPKETTIASMLKNRGYSTEMIGKWHLGDQPPFLPLNHGFDGYLGLPYSNDMHPFHFLNGKNVDFPPLPYIENNKVIEVEPDQTTLLERYTNHAIKTIRKNRSKPFFLYFSHFYVHIPLEVPKRFLETSRNGKYGAAVEAIDWSTGKIIKALEQENILDNTLIIFTSDNGGAPFGSNRPLRGGKGSVYEGGFRVPGIFKGPGINGTPGKRDGMMNAMDILPTIASLTGAELPELQIDGLNQKSFLDGSSSSARESFFYYCSDNLCAIRKGPWKLIKDTGPVKSTAEWGPPGMVGLTNKTVPKIGLFNLEKDLIECIDLSNEEPDKVIDLHKLEKESLADLGDRSRELKGKGCRESGYVPNPQTLVKLEDATIETRAAYDLDDYEGYRNLTPQHKGYKRLKFHKKIN